MNRAITSTPIYACIGMLEGDLVRPSSISGGSSKSSSSSSSSSINSSSRGRRNVPQELWQTLILLWSEVKLLHLRVRFSSEPVLNSELSALM